ncbi:protein disulfide-isomerase-like protein of the testis [Lissotriton helveticus]
MRASLLFFLLSAGFSLFLAEAEIGPNTSKAKKVKAPKIKEEENVLVLTSENFGRALKEYKYLLVTFYIALSGPSQTVGEEFSKAAELFKKSSPDVRFGKVDITAEKALGKEFEIKEFPTLKLFVSGDRKTPTECKGVRSASAFVTWLNRRTGPSTVHLNSTEQAVAFIESEEVAIIGFFKELHGGMADIFYEAAKDVPELAFGVVSSEDISAYFGVTKNAVTVFHKGKPVRYEISERDVETKLDLIRLIRTYNMDLVTEYNLETSVTIFDVPVGSHILLFTSKTSDNFSKIYENYESAAVEFRGKIMFILVDTNETRNGRLFEYFRITEVDVPAVRILNLTSDAKYQMPADDVTSENLRSFCQSYLEGKAKPKLATEEIPDGWDQKPVKELVGKNFNYVAFNKSSHAFIMFYAPWSQKCKELFPIWDVLGSKYQHHENITIARIDCTANEIQLMVLDRYPYFRYFPEGSDTQAVRYTGEKTLEAFTEFLEQQTKPKVDQENSKNSEDSGGQVKEDLRKEEL